MILVLNCKQAMILSYKLGVSSENNFDWATFFIDETQIWRQSGRQEIESTYTLSAGTHTLTFNYSKDPGGSTNNDCFYIYYLRTELAE